MSRPSQVGSATPARITRARSQTPLPGLATKQSHAYGAQGKTNLHTQVRTTTNDFAAEFATGRVTRSRASTERTQPQPQATPLNDRQGSEESQNGYAAPRSRNTRSKTPVKATSLRQRAARHPPQPQMPIDEDDEDEDDDELDEEDLQAEEVEDYDEEGDDGEGGTGLDETEEHPRNATALERGFGYRPPRRPRTPPEILEPVPEPSRLRVWFRAVPRWLTRLDLRADGQRMHLLELLGAFFAASCMLLLIYAQIPLSGYWATARFNQFWTLGRMVNWPGYSGTPEWAVGMWYQVMHDNLTSASIPEYDMPPMQWRVNINVLNRLDKLENSIKEIHAVLGLQSETMDYLSGILPNTLMLQQRGDRYEIPQHFWAALRQRLVSDDEHLAPLWQSFIDANEERLDDLTLRSATRVIGEAAERSDLVTKERFIEVLDQHNVKIAERYTQDYRKLWEQNIQQAREYARQTTEETLGRYSTNAMVKKQLETLVKATDVHNTYEALRQYNWFTYGHGVVIDPHMTTPGSEPADQNWIGRWWAGISNPSYVGNRPVTVLLPWTEVTECWCATKTPDGSAQISLLMGEHMYPNSLIMEHIPAQGTRNIKNAPRDIEIWVDVGSEAEVERFAESFERKFAFAAYSKSCTQPPSPTHICVYQGRYDIHDYNHVQTFPLWIDAIEHGLAVNRITVRIVNNWGGERTCIYRLRLTGDELGVEEASVAQEQ